MTPTATILTPAQVDDLCIAFDNAKSESNAADAYLSTAKGDLVAAVRAQGYTPAHAEKTTRLDGVIYTADITEGSTIAIVEDRVAELQSELSRLKKPALFKKLFARRVSHSLVKGAPEALKLAIGHLDDEKQKHLLGIFAACTDVDTKAPSLKVQLSAALREKEEKAAAKAAKKPRAKKGGE